MADTIYKYELTNGLIYIGRDHVGKYKRAVDHMNNALAYGFQNSKYDGVFVPAFIKSETRFSVGLQKWEPVWGEIIKQNINNDNTIPNRLLTKMGFNINQPIENMFNDDISQNNFTYRKNQKEDKLDIKKMSLGRSRILPREIGLNKWSFLSANDFCSKIKIPYTSEKKGKKSTFYIPLIEILPKVYQGNISDITNFTEFIITAKYFSNSQNVKNMVNREAGDYVSFLTNLNKKYDWSVAEYIDDSLLLDAAKDAAEGVLKQQNIFKTKTLTVSDSKTNNKNTIDIQVPTSAIHEPIINECWKAKETWHSDTNNMFKYALHNIHINTTIIHNNLPTNISLKYNDIMQLLETKKFFLQQIADENDLEFNYNSFSDIVDIAQKKKQNLFETVKNPLNNVSVTNNWIREFKLLWANKKNIK